MVLVRNLGAVFDLAKAAALARFAVTADDGVAGVVVDVISSTEAPGLSSSVSDMIVSLLSNRRSEVKTILERTAIHRVHDNKSEKKKVSLLKIKCNFLKLAWVCSFSETAEPSCNPGSRFS